MRLFRPIGMHELALIWDKGFKEFPPRLPHQPFYYPVTTHAYARQIASEWNVKDAASAYAGYVTQFEVRDDYLSSFDVHVVGASTHSEYWIPANELPTFNQAIDGRIEVIQAFFGDEFQGYIPEGFALKGKGAIEQFVCMANLPDYSRMDFTLESLTNCKAIYLNAWFWATKDFSEFGISAEQKRRTIELLREVWKSRHVEATLPTDIR